MAFTIPDLHQRLIEMGYPVPTDLEKFRHLVWSLTKSGQFEAPVRKPRLDGRPGLNGYYSDEALVVLTKIIEDRYPGWRSASGTVSDRQARNLQSLALSFRLPDDLAEGLSLPELHGTTDVLAHGIEWLVAAPKKVHSALKHGWPAPEHVDGGRPARHERAFLAALKLGALGYKRAEELARELGISEDEILGDYVFTFTVEDGKITAHATTRGGHAYRQAAKTE